jgi:hypothetical protein
MRQLILLAMLVLGAAPAAAGPLLNGDFETGGLQEWISFGTRGAPGTVWGVPPTSGSHQAYLIAGTEGCYYCGQPGPHPRGDELGIRADDYTNPVWRTSWVGHISGSAIVQDFNAPRDAILQFDVAHLGNDGCAAPPTWQWDITVVMINGVTFNLCDPGSLRGQRLTEGGSRGGELIYESPGVPSHYIGYRYFSGYLRYAVPLAEIAPSRYPRLGEPGYRLSFFTGQDGGDLAGGYALLIDNVRVVPARIPEPAPLALLLAAFLASLQTVRATCLPGRWPSSRPSC